MNPHLRYPSVQGAGTDGSYTVMSQTQLATSDRCCVLKGEPVVCSLTGWMCVCVHCGNTPILHLPLDATRVSLTEERTLLSAFEGREWKNQKGEYEL